LIGYFNRSCLDIQGTDNEQDRDTMNRLLALMTALLTSVNATALRAEQTPVVVELFTSQGCASCPEADEMLARLGSRENVIALALHVDYWDYIGWKDKFALSGFTKRQKGYAHVFDKRMIYTPQMVVNGVREVAGNRPMDVTDLVQAEAAKGLAVPLTIERSGDTLSISAPAEQDLADTDVILVRYTPSASVDIPRGENAGKTLSYSHIVTEWSDIGDWNGQSPLSATVPVSGASPIVVLVQEKGYGPIRAAARLR